CCHSSSLSEAMSSANAAYSSIIPFTAVVRGSVMAPPRGGTLFGVGPRTYVQAACMVKGETRHTRSQAERSATTRAALVTAARALFAEHGYAGTPREQIVADAGVTRGALQHHFGDKPALFQAVYEQVEQEIVEAVAKAAMRAADDPVEQLRAGCQ